MNDIQTKIWEKEISKLTKRLNKSKLEEYKDIIMATSGVDDDLKQEYVQKCDEAINKINNINADKVKTGEKTKHSKLNKKAILAALGVATVITVAGIHCHSCSGPKSPATKTEAPTNPSIKPPLFKIPVPVDQNNNNNNKADKEIKDTLNFDTENTEVLVNNINNFISESIANGLELDAENLENDVESFIDFYLALNIEEIGPGYLAKFYQNDNKSYLDMFNNFTRWAMEITDEAMMSSKKDNTVFDVTKLVSNKNEAAILQEAFNLLATQHDNGLAGDKEALQQTTTEFRSLLDDTLLNESSDSYSAPFKVILAYSAMNFDTLLQNYADISLLDDDTRKVLYEDAAIRECMILRDSINEGKKYSNDDLLLLINTSEKSQSAVSMALQLEKKIDQMVMIINTTDVDYSSELSVNEVIDELVEEIDLSNYKPNQEYTEYNDLTYEINHPTITVPEDSITVKDEETDKEIFIEKEEIDKYVPETENKTPEQIKDEYEQKVEEKVEEELKDDKTFEDNNGNVLEEGEDAVDYAAEYSKGYTAGSAQGAKDGNALVTKNDKTTGSEGYVAGYAQGYNESYEEAAKARKDIVLDPIEIKPIEDAPIVIMPIEEKPVEIIAYETQPAAEVKKEVETTTVVEEKTTKKVEETKTEKETTTEKVAEEETTKNTSNEIKSSQMSYEELYQIYYDILYGSETNTIEQGYAKTK